MSVHASRRVLLAPAALLIPVLAVPFLDGPPPGHTGGFGEPTCRACHFDGPVDDPAVSLRVDGIPRTWKPGTAYPLEVVLTKSGLPAGGFQLAARFVAGSSKGEQAGTLLAVDERVAVADSAGILYAQHAAGGTAATAPDTVRWSVTWRSPTSPGSAVAFHAAANASNDDASAFGDVIVTTTKESGEPCAGGAEGR